MSKSPNSKSSFEMRIRDRELRVGRKIIELIPDDKKMNPNSLRFLLGAMINFYLGAEREAAIEEFRKLKARYVSEKFPDARKEMNVDALRNILNDDGFITYWQIEAFSHAINLPSGPLLSLSHMLAHIRDDRLDLAHSFVQCLHSFADCLEKLIDKEVLSKSMMDEMVDSFEPFTRLEAGDSKRMSGKD